MADIIMNEAEKAALYEKAREQYMDHSTHDNVAAAAAKFEQLGDYERSAWYLEKCRQLLTYGVGNVVEFGSYEGKPIRWRVVAERGKLRLLFADDVVARQPYNTSWTNTYWNTSSLRSWLNHEFLHEAFSREEQMLLVSSIIKTGPNPVYGTFGGSDAMDKVFLFSIDEVQQYLPTDEDRATGTWWWTRTPGMSLVTDLSIYEDGTLYQAGININYEEGGVRPAVWFLLK